MNNLSTIISVVEKLAPELAGVLGGPVGLVVSTLLSNFFGVHPDNLASTIQADPNAEFKLSQFKLQHAEELAQLASADYATEVKDRISARERDEEIIKAGKTDWVLSAIAIIVVIGFFLLCGLNYFFPLKDDHVLIMLIGQVSSGFVMVLSFFFGSSKKQT